jgi:hypothetical protein
MAFAPGSNRLALTQRTAVGQAHVLVAGVGGSGSAREVFAGAGRFSQLAWSPNGAWLLVAWPAADQWLFLRSASVTGISAVRGIARQFEPSARLPRYPRIGGWCCTAGGRTG